MKKFYCFVLALMMSVFMLNAQTVEHSKLFDNVSVTLVGGGVTTGQMMDVPTPFFWDGTKAVLNGVRPMMGLELTKYITPAVGVSLEGLGFVNTTTSYTFFDESAVLANGKLNFSNWLGGYKGQPRRVEVVGVAGLGWGHDYTGTNQTVSSMPKEDYEVVNAVNPYNSNEVIQTDRNYVVYNAGAELNVNLGKERAWQINVRPGVLWFNKYTAGNFQSLPTWKHDARAYAQLGLTYKFGKSGHHNFRLCPYSVTQTDYDALQKKYDELAGREPEVREVVKETVKTETVTKDVVSYLGGKTYITFAIGSVALTPTERAKIEEFAKNVTPETKVNIVGSADSKTGTETRNFALAQRRAEVVKNVLVNDYNVNADAVSMTTALDVTNNVETSRAAVLALEIVDAD
jgi:outer membrane protein OmpA-like peptidoglycan-associated protein